ncbi:MAG: hypothetical protein AAB588_02935 [Patescibacteria group bacterium]
MAQAEEPKGPEKLIYANGRKPAEELLQDFQNGTDEKEWMKKFDKVFSEDYLRHALIDLGDQLHGKTENLSLAERVKLFAELSKITENKSGLVRVKEKYGLKSYREDREALDPLTDREIRVQMLTRFLGLIYDYELVNRGLAAQRLKLLAQEVEGKAIAFPSDIRESSRAAIEALNKVATGKFDAERDIEESYVALPSSQEFLSGVQMLKNHGNSKDLKEGDVAYILYIQFKGVDDPVVFAIGKQSEVLAMFAD